MRGWLLAFWLSLIANKISVKGATNNNYFLHGAPSSRFQYKDKILSRLGNSVFNEDTNSISWQYYDDEAQNRKTFNDHSSFEERAAYLLAVKNRKAQQPALNAGELIKKIKHRTFLKKEEKPRCQGLPPVKPERCLGSNRITKSGGLSGLGQWGGSANFAVGYNDDYWRSVADVDDFDDYDDDARHDNTFLSKLNPDKYDKRRSVSAKPKEETNDIKTHLALRFPGDYGNYDSEEVKNPQSIVQKDIDNLKRVYYEITGDKFVNKEKITKFLAELNQKLRLYSKNARAKLMPERNKRHSTRSSRNLHIINVFSDMISNVKERKRQNRPHFYFLIQNDIVDMLEPSESYLNDLILFVNY